MDSGRRIPRSSGPSVVDAQARQLLYVRAMKARLVRDCMTAPAIVGKESMTLADLSDLFTHHAISAVPIVRRGTLVGVVSTTDLVSVTAAEAKEGPAKLAADLMTVPVITASPNDTLGRAARKLAAAKVHRLVVVDRDRVVGVLSAHAALEELQARRIAIPLRKVMSSPVVSVSVDDTINEASKVLAQTNVHGLVVVDGEMPVGVFTQSEALAALKLPYALRERPVEDVMSYETICLNAATPVFRAAAHVSAMDVRRLIVVENRRVVGIASALDLLAALPRITIAEESVA